MEAKHAFLERLGLDEDADADARAIRRAYARELKLIDQESDVDGFQRLRGSYEAALEWASWRARRQEAAAGGLTVVEALAALDAGADAASEPVLAAAAAAAPSASAAQPAEPNPLALARLAFEAFCACMPELLAPPAPGARQPQPDLRWTDALCGALADERLFNLDARFAFEMHLAYLLANGWRPGHELLLPAAARVFGWESERRSLLRLGEAGARLEMALDQRQRFMGQDPETRSRQGEVLALLREAEAPPDERIRRARTALEQLVERFPHWTALVAPMEKVATWRERYHGRQGTPFEVNAPAPGAPRRTFASAGKVLLALFVLGLVAALLAVSGDVHRRSGESPAEYRERLRHPQPLYEDEPVPPARLQEIATRIDYAPGRGVQPGELKVRFQVMLDAEGAVAALSQSSWSGDPAFDRAVANAIRESKPFPPHVVKNFPVEYSVRIGLRRKHPLRQRSAERRESGTGPR